MTLRLLNTEAQIKSFIPGQRRVSSLKEPTVSREDSIVVALPSNILPVGKNILGEIQVTQTANDNIAAEVKGKKYDNSFIL